MLSQFMNSGSLGLIFVVIFFVLIVAFTIASRKKPGVPLREISAIASLKGAVGLAVETGNRLHLSLGRGNLLGIPGVSALIGLNVLSRVARAASISDRPPVATSGEGSVSVLSQDTINSAFRELGQGDQFESTSGRITGLTPFSYAAGTLPVIYDENVSTTILAGHFGTEVALITDAAERSGNMTLAGSDHIPAQAIIFATTQEPLVGEDLYAIGAYMSASPTHVASLRTQDIFRWVIIGLILVGSGLKFFGLI